MGHVFDDRCDIGHQTRAPFSRNTPTQRSPMDIVGMDTNGPSLVILETPATFKLSETEQLGSSAQWPSRRGPNYPNIYKTYSLRGNVSPRSGSSVSMRQRTRTAYHRTPLSSLTHRHAAHFYSTTLLPTERSGGTCHAHNLRLYSGRPCHREDE